MVKKLFKSVHIYRSYRQNEPGGPLFLEHPVDLSAFLSACSIATIVLNRMNVKSTVAFCFLKILRQY